MTRLDKFTLELLKAILSNPAVISAKDVQQLEDIAFANRLSSSALTLATVAINKIDNSLIKARNEAA